MFKRHGCNMSPLESYIRISIAAVLLFYALINTSILYATVSIFLFYTAFTKFCFICYIFKINERFSLENYYLSLLPKYRTSPVFIFDHQGEIVYKNGASNTLLSNIRALSDIKGEKEIDLVKKDKIQIITFNDGEKFYQIEFQGIKEEGFLLAYFTDITEVMELNEAIEETQREVIYTMGEIGETRSKETGNHVKRVALYSKELALLYGLSQKEADLLQMASPMHDIGKVGIPDAILNAPRNLDSKEWQVMKRHAKLGYEMLKHSTKPILQAAATVAHEHHEKWDGSGYPRGIRAEEIHIFGRITAVADVFDALNSRRVYKESWMINDIIKLFDEESGKHFDPKIVTLLLNNLDIFLAINDKYKE